jgi:hypothetical protein
MGSLEGWRQPQEEMYLHQTSAENVSAPAGYMVALALVILGLGVLLWPAVMSPRTLWVDEIHSLQLSQLPVARILDEATQDFHPPAYPLALKAWLKLARALGLDPGLPWARSLNLAVWVLAAGGAGFLARRYFAPSRSLLLVVAAFGGPAAAVVVSDLRSYGFAFCALALATLVLPLAAAESSRRSTAVTCWLVYAALISLALWSHLLAAIVAIYLTVAWGRAQLAASSPRQDSLLFGGAAHVLPWVIFLPWLLRIPEQMDRLRVVDTDWMTPPTLGNLARVFYWWIPFGRTSVHSRAWLLVFTVLGAVALLLPVGLHCFRRRSAVGSPPAALLANIAIFASIASIVSWWLLARLDLAATFHGPRYPLLVAGMLLIGVASAACARGRSLVACAATLAPLALCAVLGHALLAPERAAAVGFPHLEEVIREHQERPVQSVFLSPAELIPFVRGSLPSLTLLPAPSFPCEPRLPLLVLNVNPWKSLARPRDLLLDHVLGTSSHPVAVTRAPFHDDRVTATLYAVDALADDLAADLCARQLEPTRSAPEAEATATAWDQLSGDGYSYLEFTGDLRVHRWSTAPTVVVRFDRDLPAGQYELHFRGARAPYPVATALMRFRMPGADLDLDVPVDAGPLVLDRPFSLTRGTRPRLLVDHPLWAPADHLGSQAPRELGFQFEAAWITRREPRPGA